MKRFTAARGRLGQRRLRLGGGGGEDRGIIYGYQGLRVGVLLLHVLGLVILSFFSEIHFLFVMKCWEKYM